MSALASTVSSQFLPLPYFELQLTISHLLLPLSGILHSVFISSQRPRTVVSLKRCLLSFAFLNHSLIIVQVVWKASFKLMMILLTQMPTLCDDRYLQNGFEISSHNIIDAGTNYNLLILIILKVRIERMKCNQGEICIEVFCSLPDLY